MKNQQNNLIATMRPCPTVGSPNTASATTAARLPATALSIAAALMAFAGNAAANPITVTVNSNLAAIQYISGGSPVTATGSFDLSALLPGHIATSGWVTAHFMDNQDPYYNNGTYSTPYQLQSWTLTHTYYYRDVTTSYFNPQENANLVVGSTSSSASSPYFDSGNTYAGQTTSSPNGWDVYTDTHYDHNYGYAGNFSIFGMALDVTALGDLNADGILNFGLGGTGNFILSGITLTANLADLAPAAVPVPAAAWLFCSGLLGLVGLSGKRRR